MIGVFDHSMDRLPILLLLYFSICMMAVCSKFIIHNMNRLKLRQLQNKKPVGYMSKITGQFIGSVGR